MKRRLPIGKPSNTGKIALLHTSVFGWSRLIIGLSLVPVYPQRRHVLTVSCSFSLPKPHRDHVQAIYNAHMLHSTTVDPFKLALYKLMGKLDPSKRSVPLVTATTEDWLWFQLAMACFFFHRVHSSPTHRAYLRSMRKRMVVCVGLRRCCSTMENVTSRVARMDRVLAYGPPCF